MKIPLVSALVCLSLGWLHAQNPAPVSKDEKKANRLIRVIIAGQRAMPEFKKEGAQYVECEPTTKWIVPNALEIIEPPDDVPKTADKSQDARKMVWPNELINLGHFKCASTLRLRLIRTLARQPHAPPEINCELSDLIEPLIVISAENGSKGWDSPQVRVIDLSSAKVPFRTVLSLNLTNVPLVTRFETEQGDLPPAGIKMLHLPANATDVFRFRIDAQSKSGMVPVANSSYQIGEEDRLILLAVPNTQVAPGSPPLGLQMVLYKPTS